MRILVGCEESGVVRDAFLAKGHEAYSNDLLPARRGGPHLKMDVFEALRHHGPWDIVILHPDCTRMALSGNRWYGKGSGREREREDQIVWTESLWLEAQALCRAGCALENPASVLWSRIGRPQYIQPWQFGHGETKRTGILAHRLPALKPTSIVTGREQRIWKMPPGENRKRDRSETYPGIAAAMAEQYTV